MVRRLALIGSCCLVVAVVASAFAADDAAMKDLRAKWEAAQQAIKDITIEQQVTANRGGQQMTVDTKVQRKGAKFRSETHAQGMTMVMLFDGKDAWMIGPTGAQKMPMPPQMQDPLRMALPENAKITGTETVAGRSCYIVEMTPTEGGTPIRMWVDQKSPTVVKIESKDPQGGTVLIMFSDFRKVLKDYEMPFKCEVTANGATQATITMKDIKVNSGLDDKLFEAPAAGAAPTMPAMPKEE